LVDSCLVGCLVCWLVRWLVILLAYWIDTLLLGYSISCCQLVNSFVMVSWLSASLSVSWFVRHL